MPDLILPCLGFNLGLQVFRTHLTQSLKNTMDRPQAVPTQQVLNDRVIVTEWRFAPGAETGWHVHGHDYVVVPQTTGELLLETKEGNRTSQLTTGKSYPGLKGVEHNVVNASDKEFVFVEVELR